VTTVNKGVDVNFFADAGQVWGKGFDQRCFTQTFLDRGDEFKFDNYEVDAGIGVTARVSKGFAVRFDYAHSNETDKVRLRIPVDLVGDDEEGVPIFVGDGDHVAGAVAHHASDDVGQADAHVRQRRQRDERLREVDRKNPAFKKKTQREHRRQHDHEDQSLAPAEPQMRESRHE